MSNGGGARRTAGGNPPSSALPSRGWPRDYQPVGQET